MYDIIFNGKHSFNDFGLKRINSSEHKAPTKNKVKQSIPFMNGDYDFSNLYGGATYSNRTLEYSFLVEVDEERKMNLKKIAIENWLMGTNSKTNLIDEDLIGYYYLAECTDIDFENYYTFGLINVTFEAYPFKIATYSEDNVVWDNFCFETDVLQDTSFTVNGSLDITLINRGSTSCVPTITLSSNMDIVKNNLTYKFNAGTYKDYRFMLEAGPNKLTLKGNGNIDFKFKVEVI